MLVNTHCHVFNLQSVFTNGTKEILRKRLEKSPLSQGFVDALMKMLERIIEKRLKGLEPGEDYSRGKELLGQAYNGQPLPRAVNRALADVDRLGGALLLQDPEDLIKSPWNFWKFMQIGLMCDISCVTDILMSQHEPEDIVTPLMMDIITVKSAPLDNGALLDRQLAETEDQCLRYPGRVLPFYMVNTIRKDHFQRMTRVMDKGGCVGVKLYPSLGYQIATTKYYKPVPEPKMDRVAAWLDQKGIPATMHCSPGGFALDDRTSLFSMPRYWAPLLEKHPNLRICFAHLGGEGGLVPKTNEDKIKAAWAKQIIELMQSFPHRVYTDISYNTKCDPPFFERLTDLIQRFENNILWGTDFFLVRMVMSESSYFKEFHQNLSPAVFQKITIDNPLRFIGIDKNNPETGSGPNILAHIEYLRREKGAGNPLWMQKGPAASWLPADLRS